VVLFFFWKGARNCSIVGTAFCLGFEDSEICRLIEGLKNGVEDLCRVDFAHDEHIQAASLRAKPDNKRGKEFIVSGCCWRNSEGISNDFQKWFRAGNL